MRTRTCIPYKWYGKTLRIYFVSDVHVMSEACDERAAVELASIIAADKEGVIIGLGDFTESIAVGDKRFDPRELSQPISPEHLDNPFYQGALRFVKLFEQTRGKWICLIAGNHEERAKQMFHFDSLPIIAERLGTSYHGDSDCGGWARVQMFDAPNKKQRHAIDIFLTHGFGGGELMGGQALRLQRMLWRKEADIAAMGHGHMAMAFPATSEFIDKHGNESVHTRWGIEAYPLTRKHGYLARKAANDPAIGYAVAEIKSSSHISPSISVTMHQL